MSVMTWLGAGCAVVLVAGCGGSGEADDPGAESSTESPTSAGATASDFPVGTYVATATREQALAKGFDDALIAELYGPDGSVIIKLKFLDGRWTQFVNDEGQPPEPGDLGTYRSVDGLLEMTSESQGCPGCVGLVDWVLDADTLSVRFAEDGHPDDERLMVEHDYRRTA